jgi:hypothetical protein
MLQLFISNRGGVLSEYSRGLLRQKKEPPMLLKTLVAFAPVCMVFCGAVLHLSRRRAVWPLLELIGATGLVVVVLTHFCEALHLLSFMHWGLEHSAGHYLDLCSAVVGIILFPTGYLLSALTWNSA